jgi:hypothetical protein
MQREEFVTNYAKLLTSAWTDESFANRLTSDPQAVLSESGLPVSSTATVDIIRETSGEGDLDEQVRLWEQGESTGHYKLYVPKTPQIEEGELSDAELEGVAGAGDTSVTVCCCCSPCCC